MICRRDFLSDLDAETPRGTNQALNVRFWNKVKGIYEEISSDSTLLAAIDMYWEIRKLSVTVAVNDDPPVEQQDEIDCSQIPIATPEVGAETQEQALAIEPSTAEPNASAHTTAIVPSTIQPIAADIVPSNVPAPIVVAPTAHGQDDPWGGQ